MAASVILVSCLVGFSLGSSVRNASFRICKNRRLESNMTSHREVQSLVECGMKCLNNNTSNSANFIESSKICELYEDVLSQMQCDRHTFSEDTDLIVKMNNPCKNNQPFDGINCICSPPLYGKFCEQGGPKDCSDIRKIGYFEIYPDDGMGKIRVFCWTHRMIAYATTQNGFTLEYYNKTWREYKYGFGDINATTREAISAYWLGNENIYRITNGARSYRLRYRFQHQTSFTYNDHSLFNVDSEMEDYTVHYNTFNGESDNGIPDGASFSTIDRNNRTCAASNGVGFWFDNVCSKKPPLFGSYLQSGHIDNYITLRAFLIRNYT